MKTMWDHLPRFLKSLPEPRRSILRAQIDASAEPLQMVQTVADQWWSTWMGPETPIRDQGLNIESLGWPDAVVQALGPFKHDYLKKRGTRAGLQEAVDHVCGKGTVSIFERTSFIVSSDAITESNLVEPDGSPEDWVTVRVQENAENRERVRDALRFLRAELPVGIQLFVQRSEIHDVAK